MCGHWWARERFSMLARALALAALALMLTSGSAATLGTLTSASLMATRLPIPAIVDQFAGSTGSSLAGHHDLLGDAWVVTGGTVVVAADGVNASTSGTVYATVPTPGTINSQVSGDVHPAGGGKFGLLIMSATSGQPSLAATYSSFARTITLQQISATGVLTSRGTSAAQATVSGGFQLTVTYLAGVLSAYYNGVSVVTYTFSGANRTAVEAHTGTGFVSFSNTTSTFDDFQAFPR